jgi:hypothetical protein
MYSLLLMKTEGGSSADYKSAETWGLAAPAFALRRITNPAVRGFKLLRLKGDMIDVISPVGPKSNKIAAFLPEQK